MNADLQQKLICLLILASFFAGCSSFRGIPSHGGGKRFDEEQRIVAGAVRQSVAEMDLSELKGKKVRIVYDFLTTYGNGNVTWGGMQDIGLGTSFRGGNSSYKYGDVIGAYRDYDIDTEGYSIGPSFRYKPHLSFFTSNVNTDKDVKYLISTLEMKCRHEEISVVSSKQDVTLYLLVDVFGLNRSRRDYILLKEDKYKAVCELTYYAQKSDGKLAFKARRAAGMGVYEEDNLLFFGYNDIRRSIEPVEPTKLPTNGNYSKEGNLPGNGKVNSGSGFKNESKENAEFSQKEAEYLQLLSDRAKILLENKNSEEAVEVLRRIQNIDPDHTELKEILQTYENELKELK